MVNTAFLVTYIDGRLHNLLFPINVARLAMVTLDPSINVQH